MLDEAATLWPGTSRAKLTARLVEEGRVVVPRERERRIRERKEMAERTAGALTGCYGPTYRAELREDWPA
ncbi:MAG: hypothetical protein ACRD1K_18370 [Acidimicrobiales bacterium]